MIEIQWGLDDQAKGNLALVALAKGQTVLTGRDWARAWIVMQQDADLMVTELSRKAKILGPGGVIQTTQFVDRPKNWPKEFPWFGDTPIIPGQLPKLKIGGRAALAEVLGVGDYYLGIQGITRQAYRQGRRVGSRPLATGVEDIGQIVPPSIKAFIVAFNPIAGFAFDYLEHRDEQLIQNSAEVAAAHANADALARLGLAEIAKGNTPTAAAWLATMAKKERVQTSPYTAAVIGGAIVLTVGVGTWIYTKVSNPRRKRRRAATPDRRRRNPATPKAAPKRRANPKPKSKPKKRTKKKRAVNPRKPAAKKRSTNKPAAKKQSTKRSPRKANPKRKATTKKRASKRSVKKASAKRKRNPPKQDRFGRPTGNTPRSRYIRGRMAKGRSSAQAKNDWAGRERFKKKRNPKKLAKKVAKRRKKAA